MATKARKDKRRTTNRPVATKKVEAVYGVYPNRMETGNAVEALKRAGFRAREISAASLGPERVASRSDKRRLGPDVEDVVSATARMTGAVLGASSMALAAPVMLVAQAFGVLGLGLTVVLNGFGLGGPKPESMLVKVNVKRAAVAERAAKALESTGGKKVGLMVHPAPRAAI